MSTPNYTNIPAPSYIYGNSQDIHNALLANLIQETSLTSPSNFVRVVGDNLIVGTTQMSKVIIDTNLDISGNVVDDGTLTCRHMIYTISGITIANGAVIYDSYGNVSISGIIITPNRFSNLQYLDISSSLQGTINTLMMDFMMASNNIITLSGLVYVADNMIYSLSGLVYYADNSIITISSLLSSTNAQLLTLSSTVNNNTNSILTLSGNSYYYGNAITTISGTVYNNTNSITTLTNTSNYYNNAINSISGLVYYNTNSVITISGLSYYYGNSINTISSSLNTLTTTVGTKQNIINSSTALTCSSLSVASEVDTGSLSVYGLLTLSGGLTVTNGTITLPNNSISSSAVNGGVSLSSTNTWTALQTFNNGISVSSEIDSGNLSVAGQSTIAQVAESWIASSGSASPFTISYASGSVYYIPTDYSSSLASNFQVKITNIPLQSAGSRTYTISLIYKNSNKVFCNQVIIQDTGSTYLCGSASGTYITPLYSGSTTPAPSASTLLIQTFTILYCLNSSGALANTYCITSLNPFN